MSNEPCEQLFVGTLRLPPQHEEVASPFTAEDDGLGLGVAKPAELISAIHAGPDGYITFASCHGGTWQELGAVEVKRLKTILPAIENWLTKDSYFSLSSFFTQEMETLKDGTRVPYPNWMTDLPRVHRRQRNLRWLNTCFVDIDNHDSALDFPALMGEVSRAQDTRKIPPASIIGSSGRGVWIFWLLRDKKDATKPQPAFSEKIELFSRVQRAISTKLQELSFNVDAGCVSATTSARVPGSTNTKANETHQQVKYWIQLGSDGKPYTYNLYELADSFGLSTRKTSFDLNSKVNEEVSERKRKGWHARWEKSWEDFQNVRAIRGRFTEGTRSNAVFLQSMLLRKLSRSEDEVEREALELGDDCHPPLPCWKSRRIAKDSARYSYNVSYRKCLELLKVTPEEATMLRHWPRSRHLATGRKAARKCRLEMIRTIAAELGHVPSTRAMATKLGERGVLISYRTCLSDYKELGLKSELRQTRNGTEVLPPLFAAELALGSFSAGVGEREQKQQILGESI